jgi:hypothetical protein
VAATRADTLALNLGRWMTQPRWEELLDQALWRVAPRGVWGPSHPAWPAARTAMAAALQPRTVERLDGDAGRLLHEVVVEKYAGLRPEERAEALAFYASPGGRVFLDYRQKVLAQKTWGLPYVVETEPRAAYVRAEAAAREALLQLPEAQTQAVYDVTNGPLGQRLQRMENDVIASIAANVLRGDLDAAVAEALPDAVRTVRARVPDLPAASSKTWLGTVTMDADRALAMAIEARRDLQVLGTYRIAYRPEEPEWRDLAAAVPGIAPGETRPLYRDAAGRLSDVP